jgi:hypothetical protein
MPTPHLEDNLAWYYKILHRIAVQDPKFTAMINEEGIYTCVNAMVASALFDQIKYSRLNA